MDAMAFDYHQGKESSSSAVYAHLGENGARSSARSWAYPWLELSKGVRKLIC